MSKKRTPEMYSINRFSSAPCDHENGLVQRPAEKMTYEQAWCGTWFDCPKGDFSRLIPSSELTEFLAKQADKTTIPQRLPGL